MANPKVEIDVTLNDKATAGLKNISKDMKAFAKDLSVVSKELTLASGAITGGFAAAFAKAAKDIPAVSESFKSLNNSVQSMADSLAESALPSLEQFSNLMNNVASEVAKFTAKNQELVNTILKVSAGVLAAAIAFKGIASAIKLVIAGVSLLRTGFLFLLNPITLVIAALVGLIYLFDRFRQNIVQFISKIPVIGQGLANLVAQIPNLTNAVTTSFGNASNYLKGLWADQREEARRTFDALGKFSEGFKRSLKSLADNVSEFGDSVSQSMQRAFSDTLFDAITGRIHGLKSVFKALGEDILRAGLRQGTNALFGSLFGTGGADGRPGLLGGGIGGALGLRRGRGLFGGRDPQDEALKQTKKLANEFEATTANLKAFQVAKDSLMNNFNQFGGVVQVVGQHKINMAQSLGVAWGSMTQMVGTGFANVINMLQMAASTVLSMLSRGGGGFFGKLFSFALPAIGGFLLPGIGNILGGLAGGLLGGLPSGAGISFPEIPKLASGGIVRRPTIAMIGESGPEAVVPLSGGRGVGSKVDIYINEAVLNSPSNIKSFVKMLKEEMAR